MSTASTRPSLQSAGDAREALSVQDRLHALSRLDTLMDGMVKAIQKVKQSQGSIVSLPKAELDLLSQIEAARDVMQEVLRSNMDRSLLRDMFGGSCTRIARIRAICESIEFSDMNKGDQRLPTCLRACQSVEKVLVDLGDGEALREAQLSIETALKEGNSLAVLSDMQEAAGRRPSESAPAMERGPSLKETGDFIVQAERIATRSADRVSAVLLADADRREEHMRRDLELLTDNFHAMEESFRKQASLAESRLSDVSLSLRQTKVQLEELHQSDACTQHEVNEGLAKRVAQLESRLNALLGSDGDLERLMEQAQAGILARLEQHESHVSRQLEDVTSKCLPSLQSRLAEMQNELGALADREKSGHEGLAKSLERAEELWQQQLVVQCAKATARSEDAVESLGTQQAALQTSLQAASKEVERLRRVLDLDPVWDSFAHVGGLIRDLQRRVDSLAAPSGAPSRSLSPASARSTKLGCFSSGFHDWSAHPATAASAEH